MYVSFRKQDVHHLYETRCTSHLGDNTYITFRRLDKMYINFKRQAHTIFVFFAGGGGCFKYLWAIPWVRKDSVSVEISLRQAASAQPVTPYTASSSPAAAVEQ